MKDGLEAFLKYWFIWQVIPGSKMNQIAKDLMTFHHFQTKWFHKPLKNHKNEISFLMIKFSSKFSQTSCCSSMCSWHFFTWTFLLPFFLNMDKRMDVALLNRKKQQIKNIKQTIIQGSLYKNNYHYILHTLIFKVQLCICVLHPWHYWIVLCCTIEAFFFFTNENDNKTEEVRYFQADGQILNIKRYLLVEFLHFWFGPKKPPAIYIHAEISSRCLLVFIYSCGTDKTVQLMRLTVSKYPVHSNIVMCEKSANHNYTHFESNTKTIGHDVDQWSPKLEVRGQVYC